MLSTSEVPKCCLSESNDGKGLSIMDIEMKFEYAIHSADVPAEVSLAGS